MIIAPFSKATDGIAREESLFQAAQPAMLIWQADENALVVPTALARRDDMKGPMADAACKGWPVVTRGSGGGIVPQGLCTLNIAMVVAMSDTCTMDDGYRLICDVIAEALTRFEVTSTTGSCENAFCDGQWNVLVEGRKLAGTAQRWRTTPQGRLALIHAAILMQAPEPCLWPVMQNLHQVAFPKHLLPKAEAHAALDEFMAGNMNFNGFPGALVRAAEDRLTLHERQKKAAA